MFDIFDDELEQMFNEGKNDKQQKLNVAFSLHDHGLQVLTNRRICPCL